TTLITWIFCCPAPVRTTSKEVFSSAAAPSPAAAAPPGAATATGAAAVMPHSSSIFFFSSTSSSTVMLPSCSKTVSTAAMACLLLFIRVLARQIGFADLASGVGGGLFGGGLRGRFCLLFLRRFRRGGFFSAQLLDTGVEQAVQVLQRSVHECE